MFQSSDMDQSLWMLKHAQQISKSLKPDSIDFVFYAF